MKISTKHDKGVNLLLVSAIETCDTDSQPLTPEVQFRHYRSTLDAELAAVAASILFARQCGSVIDFDGATIGVDAARAIRAIVPRVEELLPINGMKREISLGIATLVVGEARRMFDGRKATRLGRPARAITWSGDFVAPATRSSTQYIGGDIFTTATLTAKSTEISAALALFVGGKGVRDIFVPRPERSELADYRRIAAGLEFVGIKLRTL